MRWLAAALIGCGSSGVTPPEPEAPPPATPAPSPAPAPTTAPAPEARIATVREVLTTEHNTYARMDACGLEAWVAGPSAALSVDDVVEMHGGLPMNDLRSDELDRTFPQILFVDAWAPTDKQLDCTGMAKVRPPPPPPETAGRVGTVLETMTAGGYTYASLDVCGETVWVAAPQTTAANGQLVATPLGSEMRSFHSPSLGRSFDSIWFVQSLSPTDAAPDC